MRRQLYCLTLGLCFTVAVKAHSDNAAKPSSNENDSFAGRVTTLVDLVLRKHIDPPTRQEMILAGVKSLYHANKDVTPKGLSGEISQLASVDDIDKYLHNVYNEFESLKDVEAHMTRGLLSVVKGRSFIIAAEPSRIQEQILNNRYVGTGIALSTNKDEKLIQLAKVFYDGPAWKAGAKRGDLIVEIDGDSAAGLSIQQVVEALRGEAGSDVEMVVRQPGKSDTRKLLMTRDRVFIPSIEGFREDTDGRWEYPIESARDFFLLRVRSIGPSTLHELRRIAVQLRDRRAKGVIIDLRSGGGILHDTVVLADSLIESGTIGHVRSLDNTIKHTAQPGDIFQGLPIAVLVGKNTSAGNVFLAAALQDNKRAIIVGAPTTGETYVAAIMPIPGRDDRLRLATAIMHRADGTPLLPSRFSGPPIAPQLRAAGKQQRGIVTPDYIVTTSGRQANRIGVVDANDDHVLSKAIEVLQEEAKQVVQDRPESRVSS